MSIHSKQISAIKLSIECLERERRAKFAAGEAAYCHGLRQDTLDSDGITGDGFKWVEQDHKEYRRYTDAIQELEDLIEILEDPGVTYANNSDLPLFAEV